MIQNQKLKAIRSKTKRFHEISINFGSRDQLLKPNSFRFSMWAYFFLG